MEAGSKITREELIEDGWEYIDRYGCYEIWLKGENRILFNPKHNVVYYTYK